MSETRPTLEQLRAYAEPFNQSLTLKAFGLTLGFPDIATVEVLLPVQPQHRGGMGTQAVNGGVLAAMFDLAIGCTAALVDPTRRSATVQLSMQFLRATTGDTAVARAKVVRAGSVLVFSEARIFDAEGNACARADGMCRLSSLAWEQGGSPAIN
jgi:uncharacterized protein (TIGR00369 family)